MISVQFESFHQWFLTTYIVWAIHTLQNANIAQWFLFMTFKGQWHPDDLINFKKIEKSSDKTFTGIKLMLVKFSSVAEWVFECVFVLWINIDTNIYPSIKIDPRIINSCWVRETDRRYWPAEKNLQNIDLKKSYLKKWWAPTTLNPINHKNSIQQVDSWFLRAAAPRLIREECPTPSRKTKEGFMLNEYPDAVTFLKLSESSFFKGETVFLGKLPVCLCS